MSDTIKSLIPAAEGWRALFGHGSAAQRSRIIGWAVISGTEGDEIVGMVIDPNDPAKIIPAAQAVDPETGSFTRYGYAAAK